MAQQVNVQRRLRQLDQLAAHGEQLATQGKQLTAHWEQLADRGSRLERIDTKLDTILGMLGNGDRLDA